MISKTLGYVAKALNLEIKNEYKDITFNGVSTDSRTIKKGQLFIPLKGENFDGQNYIKEAFNKGASACLYMDKKPKDYPCLKVEDSLLALQALAKYYLEDVSPFTIGITGSNGKTSTKDILYSIISREYKTHKTKGNFNNYIGLPLTILDMEEDCEFVILEMGIDHFGEMDLLSSIARLNLGIITNAGEAHLDDLETPLNVAKAKMEFIDNMKENSTYFYFKDDINLDKLANDLDNIKVLSYGTNPSSSYQFKILELTDKGSYFSMDKVSKDKLFINLIGKHNVYNAAGAAAIAKFLNIKETNIIKGLKEVEATGMRNELKKASNFTILDDSYKSNPTSLKASLETMYSLKGYSRKILVVGDMLGIGDDIENMHREIGKIINENEVDYIIAIGYYSEYIIWEAEDRYPEKRLFHFEEKPDDIAKFIQEFIIDDSLILVKASRPLELDTIVRDLLEIDRK